MPDPVTPPQPDPAEYGRQILASLEANNARIAAMEAREGERVRREAEAAEAARRAKEPEEHERNREYLLSELGRDPRGVLNTVADAGAKKGYEMARSEFEERQARERIAAYGRSIMEQNPDLQGYEEKLAAVFSRISSDPRARGAHIDQIVKATVDDVRRFKEESFERERVRREREERARTVGQMPFGGGTFHTNSEGRVMDEKEMAAERYAVILNAGQKARLSRRGAAVRAA